MNTRIANRREIESGIIMRKPYLLISVYDSDKELPKLPPTSMRLRYMGMSFDDAEPMAGFNPPNAPVCINSFHANEIWIYLRAHWGKCNDLVVQCEQGVSRSPAIAAAIARCLGQPYERFWLEYQPNRYVYKLVAEAFERLGGMGFLTCPDPSSKSYR